jgi:predicted ATPase/DNA-binding SARP family transcriptional activator
VADTPTPYASHLPLLSSTFIGRERERAEVKRLMAATRLLTLTGPGGCGKTRLALAVARDLPLFEHGTWFIDLGGLDAPLLIPQVVATTLGVPEAYDRPLGETLADFLQHKKLLLILDNCEHLLIACAELAQRLLDACPQLHILATTREPLNLPSETVWLVPSLALPEAGSALAQIAASEAVQLFATRAAQALPGFTVTEVNAATVEQICRRLDGIPLAIELAAARLKLLDVGQIAARLDDSLQLLSRGGRDVPLRHQTMRAALDWSYGLLLLRERILFQRLAVFAGSFTLEAVEAVCGDEAHSAGHDDEPGSLLTSDALDGLADLVDKSLVLIAEREPREAVRYRLLEPIRQYALEQLREAGAEAETRERHLGYYVHLAEQAEPQLKSEDQLTWLRRLDREHDNFRAALTWSAQGDHRAVKGLRLAKALHLFWQRRSHGSEGRRWLERVIANYNTHSAFEPPESSLYLARALVAQEWLAVFWGDYSAARDNLERGLALARSLDDQICVAHARVLLAIVCEYAGDTNAAHQQIEAAIESARRSSDRWSLALAIHYGGRILYHKGDVTSAHAALRGSEALFRESGDKWMVAAVLETLAAIISEPDSALALYEETLTIFQELDHRDVQIITTSNMAGLALIQGDTPRAQQLFEQTLAQAREYGIRATAAFCLRGLGRVAIAQGEFDKAEEFLRESMVLDQETGHQVWFALSLAGMASIAAARGHARLAARSLGAIAAFLKTHSIHLDADDTVELEQHDKAIRASMSPQAFEDGCADGQAATLAQIAAEITALDMDRTRSIRTPEPAAQILHLYALGTTRVALGERPITAWVYVRVKELLFYLIAQPPRTKAQLGLALWPDVSPSKLRNSLSTALYHLRRALGHPDWILFDDDEYRFNRDRPYWFDVEVFEANLAQARRVQARAPDRAIGLLREALALYHGDFVEDFLEGEWFLLRREELRRKNLDGLLLLGQLHFTQQEYAHSAEAYRQAIEKDEMLEEAHRELMRCYARLGERGQALRHYQTFEQLMHDELGSAPAAESTTLYERLKRGEEI